MKVFNYWRSKCGPDIKSQSITEFICFSCFGEYAGMASFSALSPQKEMIMTAKFSKAGYGGLLDPCLPTKLVSFAIYKRMNLDELICILSNFTVQQDT
jgi:hypothetical protein